MKNTLIQKPLLVKKSPIHGYGVFADTDIFAEEIIEECHLLKTTNNDINFENYYFDIQGKSGIPLGFGCIYNHSAHPNAHYYYDEKTGVTVFKATQFIARGEEIFVSYGKDWFDDRQTPIKEMSSYLRFYRFFVNVPLRGILVFLGFCLFIYLFNN